MLPATFCAVLPTNGARAYRPAFGRFGLFALVAKARAASSSSAPPMFCREPAACRTSDRLLNLFAAPERGLCFLPSPVGGWFFLLRFLFGITQSSPLLLAVQ